MTVSSLRLGCLAIGILLRVAAPAEDSKSEARFHYEVALAALKSGDLATASAELETAQKLDPQNGLILYNLAVVRRRAGKPGSALEALKQALNATLPAKTGADAKRLLVTLTAEAQTNTRKKLESLFGEWGDMGTLSIPTSVWKGGPDTYVRILTFSPSIEDCDGQLCVKGKETYSHRTSWFHPKAGEIALYENFEWTHTATYREEDDSFGSRLVLMECRRPGRPTPSEDRPLGSCPPDGTAYDDAFRLEEGKIRLNREGFGTTLKRSGNSGAN
jgi:tetratricopeptide (TPR) repeat protein